MVIGGAKGALGLNPATAAAGAAAGAFTGSYATERASKILDVMREKGMDPNDPASIQSFFNDPEKLAEARDLANKRAIPVALFDAATFGLAGRFMRPLKAAKAAGEKVAFSRDILQHVLENYAAEEPGVRELKRCIEQIIQRVNMLRMFNVKELPFHIPGFTLPFVLKKEHVDLFLKKKDTGAKLPFGMYT
jgi:hypothetical protein